MAPPLNHTSTDVIEISDPSRLPARPVVSVLMLTYRHEKYLADAIEGVVRQQTDFPIELVIAEDCSPDGTMAIAKRYQRKHPELIRIITSSNNVGGTQNGARATAACRGEFIAYCEGDDYWHDPEKLRRQVDIFRRDPEVTLVHTAWNHRITWHGMDRVLTPRRSKNFDIVSIQPDAFQTFRSWARFAMTCTAVVKCSTCRDYRAKVDWRKFKVGDWPLFTFLSAHGKVAYIDLPTATYRHVPGSAMNSGAAARIARVRNANIIHDELCRALGPRYNKGWSRKKTMARHLYIAAMECHDLETLKEARDLLEQADAPISPTQFRWDAAKTRWPVLHHTHRVRPGLLDLARKYLRYRPVPTPDALCFAPKQR